MDVNLNVSRETHERLEAFSALVEKWTTKINLISKASVPHLWNRHIIDSAQVFDVAPKAGHWVDIGSGGGFPGIVIAILAQGAVTPLKMTLIESDQRKCAFLRTAFRELSLDGTVICGRIEEVPPQSADILSARALSDLSKLLEFADRHLDPKGVGLFPKGESWQKEHAAAQANWTYHLEAVPSTTNSAAAVLKIKDINHV